MDRDFRFFFRLTIFIVVIIAVVSFFSSIGPVFRGEADPIDTYSFYIGIGLIGLFIILLVIFSIASNTKSNYKKHMKKMAELGIEKERVKFVVTSKAEIHDTIHDSVSTKKDTVFSHDALANYSSNLLRENVTSSNPTIIVEMHWKYKQVGFYNPKGHIVPYYNQECTVTVRSALVKGFFTGTFITKVITGEGNMPKEAYVSSLDYDGMFQNIDTDSIDDLLSKLAENEFDPLATLGKTKEDFDERFSQENIQKCPSVKYRRRMGIGFLELVLLMLSIFLIVTFESYIFALNEIVFATIYIVLMMYPFVFFSGLRHLYIGSKTMLVVTKKGKRLNFFHALIRGILAFPMYFYYGSIIGFIVDGILYNKEKFDKRGLIDIICQTRVVDITHLQNK